MLRRIPSWKKRKRKLRLPTLTQNPTQHTNEGRILCPNLSWYVCGDLFNKHISRGGANLPYQSKTSWQPLAIHWDRRQHPLVVHHGLHFYDSYHHMAVPFVGHDRWHHFYDRSGLGVVLNPWYLSLVCILLFGFLFQTIGTKKKTNKNKQRQKGGTINKSDSASSFFLKSCLQRRIEILYIWVTSKGNERKMGKHQKWERTSSKLAARVPAGALASKEKELFERIFLSSRRSTRDT